MTVTMNAVQEFQHRGVLQVMSRVFSRGKSLFFDSAYAEEDTYGNKFLYPGMIVGMNDDKTMYVPWNDASSYGAYSAYAVGIIDQMFDCTFAHQVVAPAVHCEAYEAWCYVYGSGLGSIPDAVKQATGFNFEMRLVQWQ